MELREGPATAAGLDPRRLDNAYGLLSRWAADGTVPGCAVAVARHGIMPPVRSFGTCATAQGERPVAPDSVFLVASVTKPVTATAVMLLVERGLLSLHDRVRDRLPEFTGDGRDEVRLLHLLTHTSGLPDMLPENTELRQHHAPLTAFIQGICATPLLFRPGTRVRYQSMGTALLGEIVQRISNLPLREFIAREICDPLGMHSASLGLREDLLPRLAPVLIPREQLGTNWHWNTPYWRNLGAPWGGMFATVADLMILLQTFLDGGIHGRTRLLGSATTAAMLRDQTSSLPELDPVDRRRDRWGLGWKLSPAGSDLSTPHAFGHSGATGTQVGADLRTGLAWAVFSTRPGAPLQYVANALNAAVVD